MVYASDFSGLAYLAIVAVIACIAGAVTWLAGVWWGTSWLLRNRREWVIISVLCVVPVLVVASTSLGYPGILGAGVAGWLQATWMLVVARVVASLIANIQPSSPG